MRIVRLLAPLLVMGAQLVGCAPKATTGGGINSIALPDTETAAFIVRLGTDTIQLEQFSRSGRVVEGELVSRAPTTAIVRYRFRVDSTEGLVEFKTQRSPVGQALVEELIATRSGDGFQIRFVEGDSVFSSFQVAPSGAVFWTDQSVDAAIRSVAVYEIATRRLVSSEADFISVPLIMMGPARVRVQKMNRLGADSVVIHLVFPRGDHARVDAAGRILGVNGTMTSYKWMTERVAHLNMDSLASAFAARDLAGKGAGPLSGRDTVRGIIDGAQLAIDYGRPSKRGRVIFGGIVPWGQVWRMGADEVTQISTDRTLVIAGLTVPPGTYSLDAIPSPAGWQLIVNRHVGQSGLRYFPAEDVGRVAFPVRVSTDVVERLTFSILPRAEGGGLLRMSWDGVVAEVPFAVH